MTRLVVFPENSSATSGGRAVPMEEYPALFSASDSASLVAQKAYLCLLKGQLVLLILASFSGSIAAVVPTSFQQMSSIGAAVFLVIGLLLMWILRAQGYDKVWFDCRAVAESVKTAAWRYMMRVSPYDLDQGASNVDTRFIKHLKEIRAARPGVETHLAGLAPGGKEISDYMRQTRGQSLEERKEIYRRDRVLDQKTWYEGKARFNRKAASVWFWTIAAVQMFALIIAIVQSAAGPLPASPVSILMTLAVTLVAWTQVKRYQELPQSYGLAAQELSALEALEPSVSDPRSFQEFVIQVEETISREHTMWCSRRNVTLGTNRS